MIVLYVAALSAGFLLAVYAMLHGVERGGASYGETQAPARRTRLSLPALAAACAFFGATGYAFNRWGVLGEPRRALLALAVGGLAASAAVALVRRWARAPSTEQGVDPRFFLMGHLARVTRAIEGAAEGAITYEMNGARHASAARSADGSAMAADTDVVIERIEDGVAYVEAWSQVEQRL